MPALGYKKSRTGCLRCKQRRVKCDENRPCRACARHNVECSLVRSPSQHSQSPSASHSQGEGQSPQNGGISSKGMASPFSPSGDPFLPSSRSEVSFCSDPYPYFARFTSHPAGQPSDPSNGTCMIDLELMHHWSTHTCLTLARSNDAIDVWKILVPRLAFRHQFLMNQLLATAAYHLAFLNSRHCHVYSLRASQHQDQAISLMRVELGEVKNENCDALFAVAVLLLFGGFAGVTNQVSGLEPSIDDVLDIFLLTKGIGTVLKTSEETISKGTFKEFFGLSNEPVAVMPPNLQTLLEQVDSLRPQLKAREPDDRIWGILEDGITGLISCLHYAHATARMPELRLLATWPMYLSNDFITLIRQRYPPALAILSHFCVVLCIAESTFWYMKGWGLGVSKSVAKTMDPSWGSIIEWPLNYIIQNTTKA